MIILYIYLIGFFIIPIIMIGLEKIYPGSMELKKNDSENAMVIFACGAFWPLSIIYVDIDVNVLD